MSKAYIGYHQLACLIIKNNVDNKYLANKNSISFGIRKSYMKDENGTGVMLVPFAPQTEDENLQLNFINERTRRGLKYAVPNLASLDKIKMSQEISRFLLKNIFLAMNSIQYIEHLGRVL